MRAPSPTWPILLMLGNAACQEVVTFRLAKGGARSAILETRPGDEAGKFRNVDLSEGAQLDLSEALGPSDRVYVSLYGCGIDGLSWPDGPGAIERTCLPATGLRFKLDPWADEGWTADDQPPRLPACGVCQRAPLRLLEQSSRRDLEGELTIDAALMLDADTVLVSLRQKISELGLRRSLWRLQRGGGFQELELIVDPDAEPFVGFTDLAWVEGEIVGLITQRLQRVRLDGDRAHLSAYSQIPFADLAHECELAVSGPDLYVASGLGALFRRRSGAWQQLTPARPRPVTRERVDGPGYLARLGDVGIIGVGVTTSTADYYLRDPTVAPTIARYYADPGDGGAMWSLPSFQVVAATAEQAGQTYVLGTSGSLYAVGGRGQPSTELSGLTMAAYYGLHALDDRLLVSGRDGTLVPVFPSTLSFCSPQPSPATAEVVSQGRAVVHFGIRNFDVSWYDAVPSVDCALDPP